MQPSGPTEKNPVPGQSILDFYPDRLEIPWSSSTFINALNDKQARIGKSFLEDSGNVLWKFRARRRAEGPPGHCHGGFLATLIDESIGSLIWCHGLTVLAADLNVRYRAPVPLKKVHYIESWIERMDRRRVYARSILFNKHGKTLVEGRALFIRPPEKQAQAMFEHSFPAMARLHQALKEGASHREIFENYQKDSKSRKGGGKDRKKKEKQKEKQKGKK
jgi:acyl-coenzyme A thioesterase PaaI-like protein